MASADFVTDRPPRRIKVDMTGVRHGLLVGLRPAHTDRHGRQHWIFRCDCGRETRTAAREVRKGHVRSCGCLIREASRRRWLTHGATGTPEYRTWQAMKHRCLNPNTRSYPDYGARGIRVAPVWAASFARFLADVGPRPTLAHRLDRIDNDGNYEPGNCQWATITQQNRNRRTARKLTPLLLRCQQGRLASLMLVGLLLAARRQLWRF